MNNPGDNLDLSNPSPLDAIIDYRKILVAIIGIISIFLGYYAVHLETDPTLKTGVDTTSEAYKKYQDFVGVFGNEEFTVVVVKTTLGVIDSKTLAMIDSLTGKLESIDGVSQVISLSNLRIFRERDGSFGSLPLLERVEGNVSPLDVSFLESLRLSLPMMNLMLSPDFKTFGIAIRVEDGFKYDDTVYKKIVEIVDHELKGNEVANEYRIVGPPFIRKAIVHYSIQTGVVFGSLCMLIGTLVSIYIFKSFKVTLVTNFILGLCVLWVLGLMVLMEIPLNSTTALAFGFIPITTIEIVIHIVVRYHQFHRDTQDRIQALKQSVRWLAKPCFICVATTSVGFGTLMISSVPMVRELGFIMSVGVMISYCLAIILTPAFFSVMKILNKPESNDVLVDWLEKALKFIERFISRRAPIIVLVAIGFTIFLVAGAPNIRSDAQIFRMLDESTKTVQDLRFVQKNLSPAQALELFLESEPGAFKKAETWKKISELEDRIRNLPDVMITDSYASILIYINEVAKGKSDTARDIYSDSKLIPQLFFLTSLSEGGKRMTERYISDDYDKARITILIKNAENHPIGETISQVKSVADDIMGSSVKSTVTGDLVLVSSQTEMLIRDQVKSIFIAAILITILMMIQLRSFVLGLICLIPNIPPVAAVFGLMGWFGISLDMVTVFAATVAVGLAVDNTIHYLTQLKREITLHPELSVEENVFRTYRYTARQIASWSFVVLLGFLALTVSPFRPVVFFGILGCSAITLGLLGDLIFLPSLILASKRIRKTIIKICERENKGHILKNIA